MDNLSVGDRVRFITPSYLLGRLGTIVARAGEVYLVRADGDNEPPYRVTRCMIERSLFQASPTSVRDLRVGDMVRIKSREWYENNKDLAGCITCEVCGFVPGMAEYCGRSFVIDAVYGSVYKLRGAGIFYYSTDMFDFSAPSSVITAESLGARIQDAVKGVCEAFGKPTVEVRLIKANKLLTNIKVD